MLSSILSKIVYSDVVVHIFTEIWVRKRGRGDKSGRGGSKRMILDPPIMFT